MSDVILVLLTASIFLIGLGLGLITGLKHNAAQVREAHADRNMALVANKDLRLQVVSLNAHTAALREENETLGAELESARAAAREKGAMSWG